jgi:release factor glutamine methyltransferase
LIVARENAARHRTDQRVTFHHGDGFQPVPVDLRFDLIVANPPYIPSIDIDALEPEVKCYDPRLALDGGPDGLAFYRQLATEARPRLQPLAPLMVELGDGQESAVRSLFTEQNWVVEQVVHDYTQRPRVLIAQPTA